MNEHSDWPDVEDFIQTLKGATDHPRLKELWNPGATTFLTRAPGRLDVMGGIADYSGSLVLQLPLSEATMVALALDDSTELTIVSLSENRSDDSAIFTMSVDDFHKNGKPLDYDAAKDYFRRDPSFFWAGYVAGAFLVLMKERGAQFSKGARIVIQSNVPEGKGVASSAALEVAAMMAIDAAYGFEIQPRDLSILCQKVENLVVGAPCGIMDQMSSVFGESQRLLALLCQPAEIRGTVAIPKELAFFGIDSGITHAVSGADYSSVRVGAFMGYRILQELAEENFGGYLANVTPSELEQHYVEYLPDTMTGEEFIKRYARTTDIVTKVEPSITYSVRRPTAHPIYENHRLQAFSKLLKGDPDENATLLGELMYQSHASYSACGLGSTGTDRLVELLRSEGVSAGIYGAKITGGGSGGTVAVLGRSDAEVTIHRVAQRYADEMAYMPILFTGSSDGAARFGHRELKL
jgi:L-arabinokinase